ncbi:MAG: division/cell wall cluster transcriptional repressor MraZ [Pirellulales bacterium]
MSDSSLLTGEFARSLDERFRLSLPADLADPLTRSGAECMLVKERPGCLSLWARADWQTRTTAGLELVQAKLRAGKLQDRWTDVQRLGRLLSTRHREVQLAGRGRLVVPEGFREFLQVQPGGDVIVVGAAVCVELWQPDAWLERLRTELPNFQDLFDDLTR